jgi:glutamate/tyrosine decarboxylase-like PLP-dependent enzyme
MNPTLKQDRENRSEILRRTFSIAEKFLSKVDSAPPGLYVDDIPMDVLPENGSGALETLDFFEKNYAHLLNHSSGPRYFGFVTGGSTPASLAADWLVSAYDQNACGSHDSIAPQIEHQTINYFRQLFGLDEEFFGTFVTGATMSNFCGLALARQWVGEKSGIDASNDGARAFDIKIVSGTPHSSVIKSLSMLGIGRKSLHRIDTLPEREAIDVLKLEKFLLNTADPIIVVANAGTVNTGDFDDLQAIGALKKKYNFWLHVDAAFGGFAACSEKFSHLMKGINAADSITIDAHKWLNVPYDSAMQFTRHQALQLKIFQIGGAYLSDPGKSPDFFHYTPESSRRWRALPAWFSLRAYGRSGYGEIVERNCSLARHFGELIDKSERFSLLSPVKLNIVCFTPNPGTLSSDQIQRFLNAVRDHGKAFFTATVYHGIPAIRAAVSNWQSEPRDIQIAFEALAHVWDEINASMEVSK